MTTPSRHRRSRLTNPARVVLAAAFALSCHVGIAKAERPVVLDRVVAVVDEKMIFRSDLLARARPFLHASPGDDYEKRRKLYRELLDKMIDDLLIQAEADRAHISASDDEVERAMDEVAKVNKLSRSELTDAVKKQGMTIDEYKAEIRRQLLDQKWTMLRVRTHITLPTTGTEEAKRQVTAALLEVERKKALNALRARSFVEVRW